MGSLDQPKIIKQYFFETDAHSDWSVGSPLTFEGEWEGKLYQDKGTILANKTNKLLRIRIGVRCRVLMTSLKLCHGNV